MTNPAGSPAAPDSRRRTRTQKAWKVEIQLESATPPRSASVRAFISPAALLVKVAARIWSEGTPRPRTRWAIRWVMTRVFPLPAPARISTGPSTARTASCCSGFNPSSNPSCRVKPALLDGDGLREVPWLIHVASGPDRHLVGEQLQRQHHEEGGPQLVGDRDLDDAVAGGVDDAPHLRVARGHHRDHPPSSRLHFLDVRHHLLVDVPTRAEHDHGQGLVDEGNRPVLHLSRGIAFGVDVRD